MILRRCSFQLGAAFSRWMSFGGLVVLLLIGPQATLSHWEQYSLIHDGTTRDYLVFLPQNFQQGMPVVFNLHGYTDDAEWYMDYTQMNMVADTAGFIAVYPAAIWPGFSTGHHVPTWTNPLPNVDDVGFVSCLVDTLKARYDIDMSRIYCSGWSNGGHMTDKLLFQLGHRFAAGAAVSGCMLDTIAADNYSMRAFPMVMCNGTEDPKVLYYGGNPGQWSVPQTVDYWVQQNACLTPGDSLALPDLDPTDSCTVEKFTYRTGSGQRRVVLYKVIGGGHSWPQGIGPGWPGNTTGDVNFNAEMWQFFKEFENPLVDVAFGEEINVHPRYVSPQGDTLAVTASIRNPAGHPVTLYTLFEGMESAGTDSVQLFDDGQHGDGAAADNVWGGKWTALGANEQMHQASLITHDGFLATRHRFYKSAPFSTAGPIAVDGYIIMGTDTSAAPGKTMSYRISLRNLSSTATLRNVKAKVRCLDSSAYVQNTEISYGDLAPGEDSSGSTYQRIRYYPTCPQNHLAEFVVDISSNGTVFWEDRFTDLVAGVAGSAQGLPIKLALEQNYPNPLNPTTTIEYTLPHSGYATLKVYNLLGESVTTLVDGEQAAGTFKVTWDAKDLPSGVYFYRLTAGGYVQSRKMVLMR